MDKRKIDVSVISDLHLATHACKAKKIQEYLKSIQPGILVLNGDIIDSWRFSRNYFPKGHFKVVRQLIKMLEKGVKIYYVTGNHDEFLRKFKGAKFGKLKILNQYIFKNNGQKTWIFHGDIFDKIIHKSKGLAKFGAAMYGFLTLLNKLVNSIICFCGGKEIIIYKSLKKRFLREKQVPSKFETQIARSAAVQGYDTVICGHTHVPKEKNLLVGGKKIHYINCGDWVENLTAAEFYDNQWHLYVHTDAENEQFAEEDVDVPADENIYQTLLKELTFANKSQPN